MPRIGAAVVFAVSVAVISSCLPLSECLKKPAGVARKEDVPFIKCQVCEKLAAQLFHQYQKKQSEISPKKISEFQTIEISENVCNLKKQEADWILWIDIVERGDKLELVEQDSEGQCNSECKTIERACQEIMDYSDTDVAEYIYKTQPQIDSLVNFLCKDLTMTCSTKPGPLPKDRVPGEAFVPKSAKEAEMDRLMKSMEGMPGAPGMKMYSRDELTNMNKFGKDDDDDDDDDEDEFSKNLGEALRQKEKTATGWRQQFTKGLVDGGGALKRHAQRLGYRVQKWWGSKKAAWSKKSSQGSTKSEL